MPKFKLNGREADFREGELVIEAAARAGVPIPHYCYHPDLSSPANCRMCLVELKGAPKLIPSCQWPCNEKMEIVTEGQRVEQAQADVMEYLLINHPLDCPICDQAGECKLQQYAYLFGPASSSMEEPKVELEKRKPIGPHVVLDQERCISCTRCVRFTHEVTGTGELAMTHRGHHSTVDVAEGLELVARGYSGNVVDMCPVGALTSRDFRFQSRVWYLQAQDTTCTLCSRGCSMTADWRGERGRRAEVKRIRARRNPGVNASWICDEGRHAYQQAAAEGRPTRARASAGGEGLDAAWRAAAALLAEHAGSEGWLGVLASGSETCEELAGLKALALSADPAAALVVPDFEDGDEDDILRRLDKAANRRGARRLGWSGDASALGGRRVLRVVEADLRPDAGLAPEALAAAGDASCVALVAHRRAWAETAAVVLPIANAFERPGTVLGCTDVLQRLERVVPAPGDARDALRHASELAREAGLPAVAAEPEAHLACLAAGGGPFSGLDPERLDRWGARLGEGGIEYLEEPPQLFTSAPRSFAEGEYLPFRHATTPPPAVHVAAGSPTAIRLRDPEAGRGIVPAPAGPEAGGGEG
jgi:NADH-quinone oxidoreductase subunit G